MKKKILIGLGVVVGLGAVLYAKMTKPGNWSSLTLAQKAQYAVMRLKAMFINGSQFE